MIRNTALLAALAVMGTSLAGWSAPDEVQQRILQHFVASKQKLEQTTAADPVCGMLVEIADGVLASVQRRLDLHQALPAE